MALITNKTSTVAPKSCNHFLIQNKQFYSLHMLVLNIKVILYLYEFEHQADTMESLESWGLETQFKIFFGFKTQKI